MTAKLQIIGTVPRRPAGTGEKGMGENPAPVQASRTVAVSGCGEGVNVV